ncbi:MAG TPA: hypothetical protein VGA38_08900 [Candidatus Limnocylindria bacterium]
MEWLWVVALLAIVFGPVVWGLLSGRKGHGPDHDDATEASGWGPIIRQIISGRGGR